MNLFGFAIMSLSFIYSTMLLVLTSRLFIKSWIVSATAVTVLSSAKLCKSVWSAKTKKIRKYILTHFLYGYSCFVLHINKYIQISCYLHAIHIFILHILYIFIAYNAICITSAFLYYMQVLLHMLLAYF